MSAGDSIAASTYARRIARALEGARERPGVLSPRDWALIDDWHARGVPLAVVLETLETTLAERRGLAAALERRGLRAIAGAVERTWGTIREGRAGATVAERPRRPSRGAMGVAAWRAARRRSRGTPLGTLLERLLALAERGEDPAELDRLLDAGLEQSSPPELLADARSAADEALAPYRGRMDPGAFESSHRRFVLDRIRAGLSLPRLGLGGGG